MEKSEEEEIVNFSAHCHWIDPTTECDGQIRIDRTLRQRYGTIVGMVANRVIDKMNANYTFNPPLVVKNDMTVTTSPGNSLPAIYFLFF